MATGTEKIIRHLRHVIKQKHISEIQSHLGIFRQFPGHEGDGIGALLQPDLVLAVLHHRHLVHNQPEVIKQEIEE